MLRLIKFAEVSVPGKVFELEPVATPLPLAGDDPWVTYDVLSEGQVRKESRLQFQSLVHFVEGTGAWMLTTSPEDLATRVSRNKAVLEWLLLLGRTGWYETNEKLMEKDLPPSIMRIFQSEGNLTETFAGGEVRNLTPDEREKYGMIHLFLAWFQNAWTLIPPHGLRPGDAKSMVTKKKLIELANRGTQVNIEMKDKKDTVAAKVLKHLWNLYADPLQWTTVTSVSYEDPDGHVLEDGRATDSEEDYSSTLLFNWGSTLDTAPVRTDGTDSIQGGLAPRTSRTANAILCGTFAIYDEAHPLRSPSGAMQTWKREPQGPVSHLLFWKWGGPSTYTNSGASENVTAAKRALTFTNAGGDGERSSGRLNADALSAIHDGARLDGIKSVFRIEADSVLRCSEVQRLPSGLLAVGLTLALVNGYAGDTHIAISNLSAKSLTGWMAVDRSYVDAAKTVLAKYVTFTRNRVSGAVPKEFFSRTSTEKAWEVWYKAAMAIEGADELEGFPFIEERLGPTKEEILEKILVFLGLVADPHQAERATAGVTQKLKCCNSNTINTELFRVLAWYRVHGLHTISSVAGAGTSVAVHLDTGPWLTQNWEQIHSEANSKDAGSSFHPRRRAADRSNSGSIGGQTPAQPTSGYGRTTHERAESPPEGYRDFGLDPVHNRRYDKVMKAVQDEQGAMWVVSARGGIVEPSSVPNVRGIGRALPRNVCTFFHMYESGKAPAGCLHGPKCIHPHHIDVDQPPLGVNIVSASWRAILSSQQKMAAGGLKQHPPASGWAPASPDPPAPQDQAATIARLEARLRDAERRRHPSDPVHLSSAKKGRHGRSREARPDSGDGFEPKRDEFQAPWTKGYAKHGTGQQGVGGPASQWTSTPGGGRTGTYGGSQSWQDWPPAPPRARDPERQRDPERHPDRGAEKRDRGAGGGGGAGKGSRADEKGGKGATRHGYGRY